MSGRAKAGIVQWLFVRGADVLRAEGPRGLWEAVAAHLRYLAARLCGSTDYVIHVTNTADCVVGLTAPPVKGLEVHVLTDEHEVGRLLNEGYEDVRTVVRRATQRLRQGAVGICAFVNREIAHIEWVAFTETAGRTIDVPPCFVDHGNKEALWGGAYSVGRFRKMGLFRHVMACALRYCQEQGCQLVVGTTQLHNVPSVQGQDPYGPRVRACIRHRRFLMWCDWREIPQPTTCGWQAEKDKRSAVAERR